MAKKLSIVFGVIFLVIGIIGLIGGLGIVGLTGIFETDAVHDWVHIISGIIFLIVAYAAPAKARVLFVIFGIIYLLVALLGFIGQDPVLGFIVVNTPDNWLHLILALAILAASRSENTGEAPAMV